MELSQEFRKALSWSAGAHAVFALILTVRAVFFAGEPIHLENAIRVDIVGLPDKVREIPAALSEPAPAVPAPVEKVPAAPEPKATLPPVPAAQPKQAVVLKPTKKSQQSALKRLEAMARLERQSRADAAAKALANAKTGRPVKGNEISKGNSLTGLTRLDHDRYLDTLEARIKQAWSPPKFLARAGLRVRVVLLIDGNGTVTDRKIVQSSGNAVFDESALSAIASAQPLPAPPESLQSLLAHQGVELDLEPMTNR